MQTLIKHRWVAVVSLAFTIIFGGLFFGAQTAHADQYGQIANGCTYTFTTDKETAIKRTDCPNGLKDLIYKDGAGTKQYYQQRSTKSGCVMVIQLLTTESSTSRSAVLTGEHEEADGNCEPIDPPEDLSSNLGWQITVHKTDAFEVGDATSDDVAMAARQSHVYKKLDDLITKTCKDDTSGYCDSIALQGVYSCTEDAWSKIKDDTKNKNGVMKALLITCLDGKTDLPRNKIGDALGNNLYTELQRAGTRAEGAAARGGAEEEGDTCSASNNPLTWVLCPIYDGLASVSDAILNHIVKGFLHTNPISTDPDDPIYKIWSSFRVWGDILLVIGLLLLVFGQAIGGGIVDAYTAKKMLPRLLVAAILVNLSIYIVALAVDITNVIGGGVASIINAPLNGVSLSPTGWQLGLFAALPTAAAAGIVAFLAYSAGAVVTGLAIANALPFIFLFIILPVVLAIAFIFLILVFRQAVILALVLVAPVAFALYCLPNTEQYFRKWWSLLLNMLLIYPIVMIIFSVANLLAYTAILANGNDSFWGYMIAFLLQFLPLFLIPYAFKLAGGVLGRIHDIASGYGKRGVEAIKGDARDYNSWRNRSKRRAIGGFTRAQIGLQDRADKLGADRSTRAASRIANTMWWGATERSSNMMAEAQKRQEAISASGRDDERYAGVGYKISKGEVVPDSAAKKLPKWQGYTPGTPFVANEDMYFDSKGRQISENLYSRAKSHNNSILGDNAQNFEYTVRKIKEDDDIAAFRDAFAQNAIAGNWSQEEAMDQWAASTFVHKKSLGSQWFSPPDVQKDPSSGKTVAVNYKDVIADTDDGHKRYNSAISEPHKVRKQFELSDRRDNDIRDDALVMRRTEDKITTGKQVSDTELQSLAMMDDVMQSLSHRGIATRDGDGEYTVSGGSAVANRIMAKMFNEQRIASAEVIGPDGRSSVNERFFYDKRGVERDRQAHEAAMRALPKGAPRYAFNESLSRQRHALRDAAGKERIVKVTGDVDRPDVPY